MPVTLCCDVSLHQFCLASFVRLFEWFLNKRNAVRGGLCGLVKTRLPLQSGRGAGVSVLQSALECGRLAGNRGPLGQACGRDAEPRQARRLWPTNDTTESGFELTTPNSQGRNLKALYV